MVRASLQNPRPTFGAARYAEATAFGVTYEAFDARRNREMRDAMMLRNNLIHNALTTPDPTPAEAEAAMAAADDYFAWLDGL